MTLQNCFRHELKYSNPTKWGTTLDTLSSTFEGLLEGGKKGMGKSIYEGALFITLSISRHPSAFFSIFPPFFSHSRAPWKRRSGRESREEGSYDDGALRNRKIQNMPMGSDAFPITLQYTLCMLLCNSAFLPLSLVSAFHAWR